MCKSSSTIRTLCAIRFLLPAQQERFGKSQGEYGAFAVRAIGGIHPDMHGVGETLHDGKADAGSAVPVAARNPGEALEIGAAIGKAGPLVHYRERRAFVILPRRNQD